MFKLLKKLNKKQFLYIFIGFIFIVFQVYLELKMPDYMSEITTLVQTEGSKMNDIILNGVYMIICALLSFVCAVITGYFIAVVAATFSYNIREKLFNKVLDLSLGEIKELKTSSLITRSTNDITQLQMFIAMGLQLIIKAPLTALWAISKILNKSWTWSSLTALAVVIILSVAFLCFSKVLPRYKIVQKLIDKMNNVTRENLNGIRVIRAFNAEEYQSNNFDNVNKELTDLQVSNQKVMSFLAPTISLVMYLLMLGIYVIGVYLIDNSALSGRITLFSDMIIFSTYALQIIMSFMMLVMIFMMLPRANVSAERINEVLDIDVAVKNGKVKMSKNNIKGEIIFNNVSFKYPDAEEYMLKNISFTASKGETIAFIGSTGSGKSTLINLIPRYYDVTDGEVLVDGINVRDYDLTSLYNKIGVVAQKPFLFNETVEDNVLFGKSLNKKNKTNLTTSLKVAEAASFVNKMEDKEKHKISQSGKNISGGQKQRLSIARAIARNPEIYIFDDSFSALDYKTDANLRRNLKKYTKDATILIVAQRVGTIMHADKIIVLDNGECVGMGTHEYLMKKCDVYKQIALSQLSKEELENA